MAQKTENSEGKVKKNQKVTLTRRFRELSEKE